MQNLIKFHVGTFFDMFIFFFFSVQFRSSQKGWSEIEVKKPIGIWPIFRSPKFRKSPGGFNAATVLQGKVAAEIWVTG